ERLSLKGHTDVVTNVAFNSDGTKLVSASFDGTMRVWNASTGREALTLNGHTSRVDSVAFSPDGRRLASTSMDRTVTVWDTASGQEVLTLKHTDRVSDVAFSPDGQRLAAGGGKTVKVWDATPLEEKPEQGAGHADK